MTINRTAFCLTQLREIPLRSLKLLAALQQWNNPYAPTREELRQLLLWSSKALVQYHLLILESHGLLTLRSHYPRGIHLTYSGCTYDTSDAANAMPATNKHV